MNHPHEPQSAAMARAGELQDGEQLRECINSGQVSAAQVVAHAEAGEVVANSGDEFACPYCFDVGRQQANAAADPSTVEDIDDLREAAAMLQKIGVTCREQTWFRGSYDSIVSQMAARLCVLPAQKETTIEHVMNFYYARDGESLRRWLLNNL